MSERRHFNAYSVGLSYASVCTSMTDEDATAFLNWTEPTVGGWRIAREAFADGTPNGSPCPNDSPGCRHVLFAC